MHRQDGLRARRDLCFDLPDVHQIGVGIDIHKDRARAGQDDRLGRGNERVRDGDHLIAGPDAHGAKNDVQRRRAVADPDAVLHAAELGELLLECLYVLPKEQMHPLQGLLHAGR